MVANLDARDGGAAIVHGNEKVVRARLSDARFFWETDKKTTLESRLEKLKSITFHEKLGTQYERVERIARLARELAPLVGADPEKAETAARLAKADLVTEMVGEFPELQGLMGRYYALEEKLDPEIAFAIEEHYKPQGPSDRTPTAPVSIAVALADKIDTLVGFWAIDEKPTGSKDPYALRRAALGLIKIITSQNLRFNLNNSFEKISKDLFRSAYRNGQAAYTGEIEDEETGSYHEAYAIFTKEDIRSGVGDIAVREGYSIVYDIYGNALATVFDRLGIQDFVPDLLAFLFDRLKVQLREQGARHDLVDAVFAAGAIPPLAKGRVAGASRSGGDRAGLIPTPDEDPTRPSLREGHPPQAALEEGSQNDDLVLVVRRVEALTALLATDDGKNLLAGYRRAANILKAEEKKDGAGAFEAAVEEDLLADKAEIDLSAALDEAEPAATEALKKEDFAAATAALSKLRPQVDAFFDDVTVNAPDPGLRANRLKLLARLRRATRAVADFDRIAG